MKHYWLLAVWCLGMACGYSRTHADKYPAFPDFPAYNGPAYTLQKLTLPDESLVWATIPADSSCLLVVVNVINPTSPEIASDTYRLIIFRNGSRTQATPFTASYPTSALHYIDEQHNLFFGDQYFKAPAYTLQTMPEVKLETPQQVQQYMDASTSVATYDYRIIDRPYYIFKTAKGPVYGYTDIPTTDSMIRAGNKLHTHPAPSPSQWLQAFDSVVVANRSSGNHFVFYFYPSYLRYYRLVEGKDSLWFKVNEDKKYFNAFSTILLAGKKYILYKDDQLKNHDLFLLEQQHRE
ncbi:hypothetical protein [Chitinophaga nivalis]|uniref:DUF4221 domain-containing protein n=1 Tax=Chitinophaga nivalis TaxID=2991709 RepID=A0ABT3IUP5_9BACT|nr:hypothetical protein [Chitinophaga nivalis]MCW3462598.1 hypothetical protein [Chitinophaga nivalis]MCW3487711.1 hypothetical protein [Chitinophaga nivalis]